MLVLVSTEGLPNGDSSSSVDSGDRGLVAKSIESSGALGGLSGGVAIFGYPSLYSGGMSGLAIDQPSSPGCRSWGASAVCMQHTIR